jgi:hypothetical protein
MHNTEKLEDQLYLTCTSLVLVLASYFGAFLGDISNEFQEGVARPRTLDVRVRRRYRCTSSVYRQVENLVGVVVPRCE